MDDINARVAKVIDDNRTYVEALKGIGVSEDVVGAVMGHAMYREFEMTQQPVRISEERYQSIAKDFVYDLGELQKLFALKIRSTIQHRAGKDARYDEAALLHDDERRYKRQEVAEYVQMDRELAAKAEKLRPYLREALEDNPDSLVHERPDFWVADAFDELAGGEAGFDAGFDDFLAWTTKHEKRIKLAHNFAEDADIDFATV